MGGVEDAGVEVTGTDNDATEEDTASLSCFSFVDDDDESKEKLFPEKAVDDDVAENGDS